MLTADIRQDSVTAPMNHFQQGHRPRKRLRGADISCAGRRAQRLRARMRWRSRCWSRSALWEAAYHPWKTDNYCINHASHVIYVYMETSVGSMIKVSAAEFQRNIGRYQDMALTRPVAVTRNGRERTVMISVEEYHRLKKRDRQVLGLEDFTDADIAALEESRAPESSKAFDPELKP